MMDDSQGDPDEVRIVNLLLPDGHTGVASFLLWEENPDDLANVRLSLRYGDAIFTSIQETFWSALLELRGELERHEIIPACYGASKNVYPSGMILSMGPGEKAYKLYLGAPARYDDLVSIFDTGTDVEPVSIATQEVFFHEWLASLAR